MAQQEISPAQQAVALARLADALLPGDGDFPAASAVGAHGILAARLRQRYGDGAPAAAARAFISRGGLDDASGAASALASEEPALFDGVQTALTYAYYEAPAVIEAIRGLGHVYNHAPQPEGYVMRPFDAAIDVPSSPRGTYVRTEDVRRVDLSGLTFLTGERP